MQIKLHLKAALKREEVLVFDADTRTEITHTWLDFETIEIPDGHEETATVVHLDLPRSQSSSADVEAAKRMVLKGY